MNRYSFGLWKDHNSFVRYNMTVKVGTSASPTTVSIQALDVNGNTLQSQANLLVRLTTGVAPLVVSTHGTMAVATGTVVMEDMNTIVAGVTAATWLKLKGTTAGVWSFTVTNTTVNELMGLVLGPCEGCFRGDFANIGLVTTVGGVTTTATSAGGVAAFTFKHAT